MPTLMKDEPASRLIVRMTPYKGDCTKKTLSRAGGEMIPTYVEAVKFLLQSYATDFNITKATPEIDVLRKTPMLSYKPSVDLL